MPFRHYIVAATALQQETNPHQQKFQQVKQVIHHTELQLPWNKQHPDFQVQPDLHLDIQIEEVAMSLTRINFPEVVQRQVEPGCHLQVTKIPETTTFLRPPGSQKLMTEGKICEKLEVQQKRVNCSPHEA